MLVRDAIGHQENPGDLCAVVSLPLVVDGRFACCPSTRRKCSPSLSRTDWRSLLRTSRLLWRRPIGSAPAPEDRVAHRRAPVTRFKRSRERVPGVRRGRIGGIGTMRRLLPLYGSCGSRESCRLRTIALHFDGEHAAEGSVGWSVGAFSNGIELHGGCRSPAVGTRGVIQSLRCGLWRCRRHHAHRGRCSSVTSFQGRR